jgi:hypothetical protein
VFKEPQRRRTGIWGHRPRRPGPHRAHRPDGDHRHRRPPARLRRPEPWHQRQPRLRVHRLTQDRRPGSRPEAGSRTGPIRQNSCRTSRLSRPGYRTCLAGHSAGRARLGPRQRRPADLGHPDPAPGPRRRRPPGHLARDLGRRDHRRPRAALPRPAHERATARPPHPAQPPGPVAMAPCAAQNWLAWTPPASWPMPSPSET